MQARSLQPAAAQPIQVVVAKSPGVAAALSLVFLGTGHLYVGNTVAGVCLIVWDLFLFLLMFTGIGAILAVPVFFITLAIAAVTAFNAAKTWNARHGVAVV